MGRNDVGCRADRDIGVSGLPTLPHSDQGAQREIARELIELEAVLIEEQRWNEWIDLYATDCVYWVPAWGRDGRLGDDPLRTLSLIYYANRAGLEDRVVRMRSGQSPAGKPPLRTAHLRGNIRMDEAEPGEPDMIHARATFTNHAFFPRQEKSEVYFGSCQFSIRRVGDTWKIARKKIILQNDYIATYLDICCL